jgi:hypothetical protein
MVTPVLYLDFDGVLHPADVRVTRDEPLRPRIYNRGQPTDRPLFQHQLLLAILLRPYPEVRIVLSTSWARAFGYEFAVNQLMPELRERVVGAAMEPARTRFETIGVDVESRGLTRWIALDDDRDGWPEEVRHLLVAPTNPVFALAEPGVAEELAEKLAALCEGRSLAGTNTVAPVKSTVERMFARSDLSDTQILDALDEDARVTEILRQSRLTLPKP